ncbi:MAG: LysM peptidoglycan-binding domain-containing protein [Bacteroidota bacterium]|nr:LysM peptidoglycan-binding domain-containing protein [Bacteroidota bacterium]MDP4233079.1 LysM peptidoglycan-binding domain-containing protein [Bacteroidota bacterium]MDP4241776.1 LysM peptidoglycan-binding domain-containing protein [Bacteroidota bacterium]MDP4289426.1 LysM peptidoglycan-binding domain-containing protein [Bacteroidota bacterium]
MKKTLLIATASLFFATAAFAQYPEDFTKDQADSTIKLRNTEIGDLNSQVSKTKADAAKASTDLEQRMADNTKCRESLYAMLGSDRNGYNAYREQLAREEQELSALRSMTPAQQAEMSDRMKALETSIRSLRDNKLVLIPDHMRRVSALSNGYIQFKRGMIPPNTTYTVGTWRKDRDCLWNIAKKPDIYNDPFAWPKIWRANQELIHNPDVIQPGWQLTINKTAVTEQDKDLTGYRHRKH